MTPSLTSIGAELLRATPLLSDLPKTLQLVCVRRRTSLGYDDLCKSVAIARAQIDTYAIGPSDRIVVGISDPLSCLSSLFAVWSVGACAVLVNPQTSADEQSRILNSVGATAWISDAGVRTVDSDTSSHDVLPDAALILMTSGTTGVPKGITHSLETLACRLKRNVAEIGAETMRHTLCPLPLFFGHGLIGNCLTPLYAGQTVHLWPTPGLQEYPRFGEEITARGITFLSSVPSMWRMVLQFSPPAQSALRRVHVGSAPLPLPLWERIEKWCETRSVYNTFGMTETANWISGGRRAETEAPEGFVGKPWGGAFRVWRSGALHNEGQGEVAVQSPSMMLGLWGNRAATQELMCDGYMLTGDIGVLANDQSLRLIGRNKHEINRGGLKVLAEEVDMMLERHPLVQEACGFGIPDEIAGEVVAAAVKLHPDAAIAPKELIDWCRTQARSEAVPFRLAIVDDIPKNDRGKISRAAVRSKMEALWS